MPDQRPGRSVLAFCADLLFTSKIDVTARGIGADVTFARSADDIPGRIARQAPALVLVDLALKDVDAAGLVRALRAVTDVPIIAFGSHVDVQALEKARSAGATQALPRSAFTRLLPEILAGEGA
jgi:CheY-like chemotaxis protein